MIQSFMMKIYKTMRNTHYEKWQIKYENLADKVRKLEAEMESLKKSEGPEGNTDQPARRRGTNKSARKPTRPARPSNKRHAEVNVRPRGK